MAIYTTDSGLIVEGAPIAPVDVVALIFTHESGGALEASAVIGKANSLADALKIFAATPVLKRRNAKPPQYSPNGSGMIAIDAVRT